MFQVDESARLMSFEMKIPVFEAFVHLVYGGFAVVEANDLHAFQLALNLFDLKCLPDPAGPPTEIATSKRAKTEPVADAKPRPTLEVSLNALSEDKVRKLIRDGAGPKAFFCCLCGKAYTTRGTAFNHIMSAHREVRDYPCMYCPETLATPSLRSIHIGKCHAALHVVQKVHEQ